MTRDPASKKDASRLRQLLITAIDSQSEYGVDDNDLEDLAIVAEGRIESLPKEWQKELLGRIAANPDMAQLIADLNDSGIRPQEAKSNLTITFKVLAAGWAVAAILLVAALVWPMASAMLPGERTGLVQPSGSPEEPGYWAQVQQRQMALDARSEQLRDYALIGLTTVVLVLSIALLCHACCPGKAKTGVDSP
jgi:hypothetical protein